MQQDTVLCVYTCINCNSIIIQTRGVCVCVLGRLGVVYGPHVRLAQAVFLFAKTGIHVFIQVMPLHMTFLV